MNDAHVYEMQVQMWKPNTRGVTQVVCAFLKKKYIHLGVAPEPLAVWNKELEGLVLKKSSW